MVPANTKEQPPKAPDWRSECEWLRSLLALAGGPDDAKAEARLARIDEALAQPEPSRPGELPDLALAEATIEAMRRGEAIEAEGIRALVAAAELGIESVRSFEIRWEADMRAIERWRSSAPSAALTELLAALEPYAGEIMRKADLGPLDEREKRLVRALGQLPAGEQGERRELIWPDHADLVVWLMQQLEHEPAWPPVAEVHALLLRLATAIMASGGNQLAVDARKMIGGMAETIRHLARQHFASEQDRAQLGRRLAEAHEVLRADRELFRGYEVHHRAKLKFAEDADLCEHCGTEGSGNDHDSDCPNNPEPLKTPEGPPIYFEEMRQKADRNRQAGERIEQLLARHGAAGTHCASCGREIAPDSICAADDCPSRWEERGIEHPEHPEHRAPRGRPEESA